MVVAIIIVMAVVIGFSVIMLIASLKNTKNQNQTIENNAEYAEEKKLKEHLEKFSILLTLKRKRRMGYENGNAYYADFTKNGEVFASLINNGAKLVFVNGARPDYPNSKELHIFAMTPKMVLHKIQKDFGYELTSQIAKSAFIQVKQYEVFQHGTKNASVVGGAIAGGVIAGGAGAVVGAVNAANKNANGGKTVTTGSEKRCQIKFKDEFVDCIIISKELIDKYGEPTSVKYEPIITNEYYMFRGLYDGGMSEYEWQKSLVTYVQKLIIEMQK